MLGGGDKAEAVSLGSDQVPRGFSQGTLMGCHLHAGTVTVHTELQGSAQNLLCHNEEPHADITRFHSVCNTTQIQAQMAWGEHPAGGLIPLGLSGCH